MKMRHYRKRRAASQCRSARTDAAFRAMERASDAVTNGLLRFMEGTRRAQVAVVVALVARLASEVAQMPQSDAKLTADCSHAKTVV